MNFTISNSNMINKIEVFNMLGKLVSTYENLTDKTCLINFAEFQKGLYVLLLTLNNGDIVLKKIIKE